MELREITSTGATAHLSVDEMLIISNALNEVCNALDLNEFATRMGAERQDVLRLLKDFGAAHDKLAVSTDAPSR